MGGFNKSTKSFDTVLVDRNKICSNLDIFILKKIII